MWLYLKITNYTGQKKVIGSKLLDIGLHDDVLDLTHKKKTIAKINKWDYMKLKKLLHSKGNQQNERQHTAWEKIFQIIYMIRG